MEKKTVSIYKPTTLRKHLMDFGWRIVMNDIFDTVPEVNRNNKLALLYESNRKNMVAVNTAVGMTATVNISNIVQYCARTLSIHWIKRSETWGSIIIGIKTNRKS